MLRRLWAGSLGLSLAFGLQPALAADGGTGLASKVSLGRPVAVEEPAVAATDSVVQTAYEPARTEGPTLLAPVQYGDPPAPNWNVMQPVPSGTVPGGSVPLPPVPGSPAEQYNCGVVNQNQPSGHPFKRWFENLGGSGDASRSRFESDHAFDNFASPVTNPFFFEDPRSLTEVRPIFIYQQTPTRNPIFHGGDVEFFGLQARLALTERWSIVMNKFGLTWMEPHVGTPDFQTHDGFSEILIGPKYTFLRSESTGTVGAVGLTFDLPVGDRHVFQDTGSLSMIPYVSLAQSFGKSRFGSFNAMGTLGYNFSVDSKRSENVFGSLHLDYEIARKIYPLVELNWFHYTSNGRTEPINFEGRDLFNFGSTAVSGHDELSLAVGARYKFNECIQTGLAVEMPLTSRRDLMDYRVTFDVIFRY